MKHINYKWLVMLLCIPFMTACNWEELPAYEDAEISAVQFYFRWASDKKDPITGEPVVKEQRLNTTNNVKSENGIIEATVTVPDAGGDFTEAIRKQVSTGKLWGQVSVSTAALITPIDGSAALGTPDDWSKERKFEVMAANGKKKVWTIRITQFNNE
ncbi:hypothetical protein C3V43_09060 [Bacteroides heparinolyticus]|uniref:DUF5018 domain-containing protein n=1 Tax=Prevotella heparinolytica TaxID=28113 RepID=A0A2R3MSQ7_9BACE|nr:hypothetical protein [Bacteroides heparinolyticus]AVM57887.1 hypothetical protein C3V43_09060 [Bacteroides heparinolyticus]TCO94939.1 hypothetical protein EV202_10436 [Bacteroides heparinolyticus]